MRMSLAIAIGVDGRCRWSPGSGPVPVCVRTAYSGADTAVGRDCLHFQEKLSFWFNLKLETARSVVVEWIVEGKSKEEKKEKKEER